MTGETARCKRKCNQWGGGADGVYDGERQEVMMSDRRERKVGQKDEM